MGRLYYKVFHPIGCCTVQRLLHVIDLLIVSCLHMVDDDLGGKRSSYRPVRICCCQRILDSFDVRHAAVIKRCTEADDQKFILSDLVLVARIVFGSITGISAEVIGIRFFTLHKLLLRIGQCIPRRLRRRTLRIGFVGSLLYIDCVNQSSCFIRLLLIRSFL